MGRRGHTVWTGILFLGLFIIGLIPFTFYLVNSLAPTHIQTIALAKVTGHVIDTTNNEIVKVRITVGPSGGCVWSNTTDTPTRMCHSHIPYKPSSENLTEVHVPTNVTEDITSCFPIALGKALALNHVTTASMGFSLLAILVDIVVLQGGISLSIVHFTVFFMWLTFILETVYISILHKRLDKIDFASSNSNLKWEYKIGEGYWFILAATILVSLITCGGNFSIEANS